jgi:uncharacterized protein YgiM (DUF1202 family)
MAADIVALVIGNNEYQREEDRLDTPVNDAQLMKRTLEALPRGADVKLLIDATKEDIQIALNALKVRAQGAKLALVFYSGHGMDGQPDGYVSEDTFLLPVDASIPDVNYLDTRAISLSSVLVALKNTPVTARAVFLDCCRSGAPKATAALASNTKNFGDIDERVKAALGKAVVPDATLVAFAASPGRKAAAFLSESDENSPFTKFLTDQFATGAGNLRDLVEAAAEITEIRTGKRQVPYVTYTGAASAIRQIVFRSSPVPLPITTPMITKSDSEKRARESAVRMAVETEIQTMPTPANATVALPHAVAAGAKGFTNSLGMKFVPLPDTSVLMCIHETRNADYAAYVALESGVNEEWLEKAGSGKEQHPVVNVNYGDAEGFCRWLSVKEGKTYRLPSDAEWSKAVGLMNEIGTTPALKDNNGAKNVYPWGNSFPPSPKNGNYHGGVDGFDGSAPVMNFDANPLGVYDLGGNVAEWCQDWVDDKNIYRVQRGASHGHDPESFGYSCSRTGVPPSYRSHAGGFRCVLAPASQEEVSTGAGTDWIVNLPSNDTLCVRIGPSESHSEVGRLSANRKVVLSGDSARNGAAEWVKIRLQDGQVGWVVKKFLSVAAAPPEVVHDFEKGTIIKFSNGQTFDLEPGKGLLGPSSDPGSQIPFTNTDGSLVALNEQPQTKASLIHIYIKGKDGQFTEVMHVNRKIMNAAPELKDKFNEEFIRVERVDGNLLEVTTVDFTSATRKKITLNIQVYSDGKIKMVP